MSTRRQFLTKTLSVSLAANAAGALSRAEADGKSAPSMLTSQSAISPGFQKLRARLHEPGPLFWAQTMFPEPGISSILGSCGFDYVMIDVEHGPFTLTSLRACVEALSSTGTPSVVRTASQTGVEIKQALDLGVDGVMIPRVETPAEAKAVIRAARYAPDGARGVSRAVRATRFGLDKTYVANANARVAVMVIIESGRGVENAKEIASVPGLDGIMIGLDDLTADLGLFMQYDHPRIQNAIEMVIGSALSAGLKVSGRPPRTSREREAMLISCGNDAIMLGSAFQKALASQRAAVL